MSTIADKLTALASVKEAQRVALSLGAGVPFAEYVDNFGAPEWLPSELFLGGELGAWYDPSDISTLFQDVEGTTPVTANGQPVGLVLDKSGNGFHAYQSILSRRPTYTEADGKKYLFFDGIDDLLRISKDVAGVGTSAVFKLALSVGAGQSGIRMLYTGQSDTGLFSYLGASDPYLMRYFVKTSAGVLTITASSSIAGGTDYTISHGYSVPTGVMSASHSSHAVAFGVKSAGSAVSTIANAYGLFARQDGAYPVNGKLYSMIIRDGVLTASQNTQADLYIAKKAGIA